MMVDFLVFIMLIWLLSEKGGELHMDKFTFITIIFYIICCYIIKPLIEKYKKDNDNK